MTDDRPTILEIINESLELLTFALRNGFLTTCPHLRDAVEGGISICVPHGDEGARCGGCASSHTRDYHCAADGQRLLCVFCRLPARLWDWRVECDPPVTLDAGDGRTVDTGVLVATIIVCKPHEAIFAEQVRAWERARARLN